MSKHYQNAIEFAIKHIEPFAKEIDEQERFPEESFKAMGEAGYFKLMIPSEFGGLSGTLEDHADVCRAFAKHCATAGLCYMMHNVALMCLITHGSDELKTKIFKDVIENNKFLALAYSELGTGTHFYISDVETEFLDNTVKFKGLKSMVTSATYASYYLVLTPSDIAGAIDNWVFPLESKGLNFKTNTWHGLGMRGNVSCQMEIDNVELDKSYRIGNAGSGQEQVFNVVAPFFITGLAAIYTAVCEAQLEEATAHAQNRKYPNGTALCHIESVQIHLAKLYAQTAAAITLTKEAARSGANGEADALAKILSARIFASEAAIELSRIAMRVGGGKAYNRNGSSERLLRDAFAGQIMAPSVDVLTVWLGKAITGQDLV